MGSTRLPGKVLAELAGKPAIAWVVRAAHAAAGVDEVWVATSTATADDPIADWCAANNVPVYRGSEHDVLDRYAGAAEASEAEVVVRLTADCPLLDPMVIAQTIRLRAMTGADYASNVDPPTWPDGLDCEVVTAKALAAAAKEATRPSDREHVTPFVRNNRARFSAETLVAPLPGLAAERWTLDTPEDLTFLQAVAARLPDDRAPSYLDVLGVLDREPQLREINAREIRNAGFAAGIAGAQNRHQTQLRTLAAAAGTRRARDPARRADVLQEPHPVSARRGAAVRHPWRRRQGLRRRRQRICRPHERAVAERAGLSRSRRRSRHPPAAHARHQLQPRDRGRDGARRAAGQAHPVRRDGALRQERHRRDLGGGAARARGDAARPAHAVRLSRLAGLVHRRDHAQSRRAGERLRALAHGGLWRPGGGRCAVPAISRRVRRDHPGAGGRH